MGPVFVWSHLSMDGRVTVTVPNIDFVYISVSLFLNSIGQRSILNPKPGVCLLQN
jgi:hypothetical protein